MLVCYVGRHSKYKLFGRITIYQQGANAVGQNAAYGM